MYFRSLLDDLKKVADPSDRHGSNEEIERIVRTLGRLGSLSVSVEKKISLLSRLQDIPADVITEQAVVQMLSSESGDLMSCLISAFDIFTDTLAQDRSNLLQLTLAFANKCLGKFEFLK